MNKKLKIYMDNNKILLKRIYTFYYSNYINLMKINKIFYNNNIFNFKLKILVKNFSFFYKRLLKKIFIPIFKKFYKKKKERFINNFEFFLYKFKWELYCDFILKKKITYKKYSFFYIKNFISSVKKNNKLLKCLYSNILKLDINNKLSNLFDKYKYKRSLEKKFEKKDRTAILHFKKCETNYIITITDLSFNVIFTCSAGMVSDTNNKKTKITSAVCISMFLKLIEHLKNYQIKNIRFQLINKFDIFFYNAFNFFRRRGFKIQAISYINKDAHHLGQRKRKPRRV